MVDFTVAGIDVLFEGYDMSRLCQVCNEHEASHYGYLADEQLWRCCACYIDAGGDSADWHPACVKAYAEKHIDEIQTMTLIEKVARAICAGCGNDPDFHHRSMDADWKYWMEYEPLARVIIKAMREPTDEMIDAGRDAWTHHVTPIWQAMIDTALKE